MHLASEGPGYGLQSGVRVTGHNHAVNLVGWPEVVKKYPSPDTAKFGMWQRTANVDFGARRNFDDARFNNQSHLRCKID
jgi:hypothetical protein